VRVRAHKTHNWVVGTDRRDAGWAIFIDGGEKACFGLFQNRALKVISSRAMSLTPNAWHHVVGVYDGVALTAGACTRPRSSST